MKYVLDTNTLIYFFKGEGRVAQHLLAIPPSFDSRMRLGQQLCACHP